MPTNKEIALAVEDDIPRGVQSRLGNEQTPPHARWMSAEKEILQYKPIHYDPRNPGSKILLGAIGSQLIGIEDNRHIMTIAGSRAGKTVTVIANLLLYPGSVICTDPKGELASKTALRRAAMGQKVCIVDPFEVIEGEAAKYRVSFNPLQLLRIDRPTLIEDAYLLVDALIVSTGQEKDPHWNEAAGHFIFGLVLFVATSPFIKDNAKHLGTVRRYINRALEFEENTADESQSAMFAVPKEIGETTSQLMEQGYEDLAEVIEAAIRGFYEKGEEERGSVLSTVRRHTQFLDFFSIKSILQSHDFDLDELKTNPQGMSVYLVLPATKMGLCNRWLRLFINQLLESMEREKTEPHYPVLACLDEFPVLGFMRQLQDAAGQIASFSVKLWIILQDWGQGKALYGDRFESFAANAGILQAFGNVDLTSTKYLSERLGQTLVEDPGTTGRMSGDASQSMNKSQRSHYPLMTHDEIARSFARDDELKRQLILYAGRNPIIIQRVEYYDKNGPLKRFI